MKCSTSAKWAVNSQLKSRVSSMFLCLMPAIRSLFPPIPTSSDRPSRMFICRLLTPVIADLISTSNIFWTGGLSEINKAGNTEDLDVCVSHAINSFGRLVCTGATDFAASLEQAHIMLDVIEIFLGHSSWKTRVFGMLAIRVMTLCNITACWGEQGVDLGSRMRRMLTTCLSDPWIEVARGASNSLSFLLQYGILDVSFTFSIFSLQTSSPHIAVNLKTHLYGRDSVSLIHVSVRSQPSSASKF